MNLELILSKSGIDTNIRVEQILFEERYPILFTCKGDSKVFLFICHSVKSSSISWIASETSYENLIAMLKNEVTLRDAFINVSKHKYMLEYDGHKMQCKRCELLGIPDSFLPTAGEFIDADEDEFADEICYFEAMSAKQLGANFNITFPPKSVFFFPSVRLTYFTDRLLTTESFSTSRNEYSINIRGGIVYV